MFSFIPYSIWQIKKRLLNVMRAKDTYNWPEELKNVVRSLNNTKTSKHGFEPNDVAKQIDDAKVRDAMIEKKKYDNETTLEDVMKRSEKYMKSNRKNRLYPGDIVQRNVHVHSIKKSTVKKVKFLILYF